jgi:hypothetical protein
LETRIYCGLANQYGFDVNTTITGSQGQKIPILSAGNTVATTQSETHSYSLPLLNGSIGVLADKFLNIGRTSKFTYSLNTSSVIPITGGVNAAWTSGATVQITLSNFSLQLEMIDIGLNALHLMDEFFVGGKSYIHGITYRTSSASLPSVSGTVSLLSGIRASCIKSLFSRFAQSGTANATNGLHESIIPLICC